MKYSERKPNRNKEFDYSTPGEYFVTICTKNKVNWFGTVVEGRMVLNKYGEVSQKFLIETPNHFKEVEIGKFVVMPNHIHAIFVISDVKNAVIVGNANMNSVGNSHAHSSQNNVGNADLHSLQNIDRTKMLLSKIVHGYKSSVTRCIHQTFGDNVFAWQKSYYDHLIRNDTAKSKIQNYIQTNPITWLMDIENKENKQIDIKHYAKLFSEIYEK